MCPPVYVPMHTCIQVHRRKSMSLHRRKQVDSSPGGWTMRTLATWRYGKERGLANRIASDYIVRYIFLWAYGFAAPDGQPFRLTHRRLDNAARCPQPHSPSHNEVILSLAGMKAKN